MNNKKGQALEFLMDYGWIINTSIDAGIVFIADYITFQDKKLNLTFSGGFGVLSLENVSSITFKFGNETYIYVKEGGA